VRLPLTLAIMDGMSVAVGDELYILPLASVVESFQVQPEAVKTIALGRPRGQGARGLHAGHRARWPTSCAALRLRARRRRIMVVVQAEGRRVALEVGRAGRPAAGGGEEPRIQLPAGAGVSGATIMGDGSVALILDVGDMPEVNAQRAGINLHDGKHAMVYSRLSRRLRDTGHVSFREYLGWLENHDGPEWQEFVNALTTNLTAFFREQHHFEIFATLLKSKPAGVPWRVWCNAASTGEEPYSIVMTALESLGANASFKLTASDIDSKVLASAAQGIYKLDNLKGLSPERMQRFFLRGKDSNAGLVRAKPEMRRFIDFPQRQPDSRRLALQGAFRRGVLPQRDDLLRRADPARRAGAHSPRDETGRHVVRGAR
jgi:chemotaxis methyl-accepting protein methylase